MYDVGYYWVLVGIGTTPHVAHFDGRSWWTARDLSGAYTSEEIEVISERLEPPVRFEEIKP